MISGEPSPVPFQLTSRAKPFSSMEVALSFSGPGNTRSVLVAFSFEEEVFDLVSFMPQPFRSDNHRGSLLQFGDHLALVEGFVDQKLVLWVYGGKMPTKEEKRRGEQDFDVNVDDYVDDNEQEAEQDLDVDDVDVVGDNEEEAATATWTKHIINVPYAFRDHTCSLLGNLPTGEILMTGMLVGQEEEGINNSNSKSPPVLPVLPPLYSYDPTKEKIQELLIGNKFQTSPLPSIGTDSCSKLRVYQYVEDIRPLENLIGGDE